MFCRASSAVEQRFCKAEVIGSNPLPGLISIIMALFLTSDLHFGHSRVLEFTGPDGQRIRPFDSLEEMHDTIIDNYNKLVHPKDTCYILGDVAIPRSGLKYLSQMNGRKVLIHGNHDTYKTQDYLKYFDQIRGVGYKDRLFFTHIPVHPETFETGSIRGNVHGHLHINRVMDGDSIDRRYFNTCLEVNEFKPVPWEVVKAYFD
jgi:calcineurin-like phosphoesterase family protein